MAGESWWDWRSPNFLDYIQMEKYLSGLQRQAYKNIRIFEQILHKQAPDTSYAAINTGVSHYLDGTTTPDEVDIKSASASDAAAGTGIQEAYILGHAGASGWIYESLIPTGVTAASSTTKLERFNAVKAVAWGTGKKAAGAITMHEDGGTTETYATIAASTSFSATSRFYIPKDWNAFIGYMQAIPRHVTDATAAFAVDTGSILQPIYALTDYTRLIMENYAVCGPEAHEIDMTPFEVVGGDDSYIDLQHITKEADNNAEMIYHYKIICYATGDNRGF